MDTAVRNIDTASSQATLWNQALLASDTNYFLAAAEQHRVRGAEIAWLPRLTHIPAGCVVQNINPAVVASNPRRWIAETEYACHHLGASQFRLYLQTAIPTFEAALYTDGFVPTVEVAMAKAVGVEVPELPSNLTMLHVTDAAVWQRKYDFHRACQAYPDGNAYAFDAWFEMEKRKAEIGYMDCYLAVVDGEVHGAVSFAHADAGVLRLKNIIGNSAWQSRGIGVAMVNFGLLLARDLGYSALGCYALEGGSGHKLYDRCGLQPIGTQTEWVRPLHKDAASRPLKLSVVA
jgi:GNAT superfamily N-acetyltransferase